MTEPQLTETECPGAGPRPEGGRAGCGRGADIRSALGGGGACGPGPQRIAPNAPTDADGRAHTNSSTRAERARPTDRDVSQGQLPRQGQKDQGQTTDGLTRDPAPRHRAGSAARRRPTPRARPRRRRPARRRGPTPPTLLGPTHPRRGHRVTPARGPGGPPTVRSEFSSINGDCRQGGRLRRSRGPIAHARLDTRATLRRKSAGGLHPEPARGERCASS